jgi:hypothetical protein
MDARRCRKHGLDLLRGQHLPLPFLHNPLALERQMRGNRARHKKLARIHADHN